MLEKIKRMLLCILHKNETFQSILFCTGQHLYANNKHIYVHFLPALRPDCGEISVFTLRIKKCCCAARSETSTLAGTYAHFAFSNVLLKSFGTNKTMPTLWGNAYWPLLIHMHIRSLYKSTYLCISLYHHILRLLGHHLTVAAQYTYYWFLQGSCYTLQS